MSDSFLARLRAQGKRNKKLLRLMEARAAIEKAINLHQQQIVCLRELANALEREQDECGR